MLDPVAKAPPAPTATLNIASDHQLAALTLQAVTAQAQNAGPNPTTLTINSLTVPTHIIVNPASFSNFLDSHKAVVAFFTSETCPPYKMMEPIFKRLSQEKGPNGGRNGADFAKVDIDVGLCRDLASEWGIIATEHFHFYFLLRWEKGEFKGANQGELGTQIDLLLFQAYPPYPHTDIYMPAIKALSTNPILFSQVAPIDNAIAKLIAFVDASSSWP